MIILIIVFIGMCYMFYMAYMTISGKRWEKLDREYRKRNNMPEPTKTKDKKSKWDKFVYGDL